MAQKKQMGAAEGLKLNQAEQDIANGKTLADVIAELKRCNETACKKEVNEIKDSQKMGAAEGLKLKKAEQDIANGKTLKEVLEELRKSNAEKKAKEKIEETLDEVDKTTKQTLNEVTGKGKKESVTVEQQVETARETAKQTGLLEKIEENTRGKATAHAEKDKSGFDFGKLLDGLKIVGALSAAAVTIWGIVKSFEAAKKWWDDFVGGGPSGPNGPRTTTEKIADAAKLASPLPGAARGFSKNAEAALKQYNIGAGSGQILNDAKKDLAKAQQTEAELKAKHAAAKPGSKEQEALGRKLAKAQITTASAQNGVDYAKLHQAGAGPSTAARVGYNTYKGFNIGRTGLGLSVLGFGLGEFAAGGDAASIARQAAAGAGGTAMGAGIGAGIGTAASIGFAGATGGFGAVAAPFIIGAFKLAGGYIGGIIVSHMEKQHANGQPLTLPPLSAFDPTQASIEDIKAFVNAVAERLGMEPPFDKNELTKPSANWKGATKDAPMNWVKGRWGADTRAYKEGSSWFIHRVDHKGKTIKNTEKGVLKEAQVAELNKLEADTLAAPTAGTPTAQINFGKSTAKPIDDWSDTLSAGTAQRVAIAGLGGDVPNSDVAIAESKTPEGEGVFGTIVSVLKSIGVGIESIVSLMSGGAAAAAGAVASVASSATNAASSYLNKAKSITTGTSENATIAMDFFKSKGWSNNQAAAIVGNLQQESTANLDPKADLEGDGKTYGIAQWKTPRQELFKDVMKKDIHGSSLQDQLEFVQWELTKSKDHKRVGEKLATIEGVESATLHVTRDYEGTKTDRGKRVNNAKALASSSGSSASIDTNIDSGKGILSEASNYLGMGESENPDKIAGLTGIKDPVNVPWCAAFVSGVLKRRGYKPSTSPNMAKSYLNYGKSIEIGQAQAGDIAVFNRKGGGHVGFYVSHNGDSIKILGGNQKDKVSVTTRSITDEGNELLAIRRPTDADKVVGASGVASNAMDAVKDPNSRTNAGMDVGGKAGANVGGAAGAEVDALFGTTGGAAMGADWGAAMGKILGGGLGAPLDIMKSILKDIPIRGIPLKEGPYSPGTTIPMNINGKGKFSQSMTSAMDLIGASNRNEDIKNNKAPKPVTISNPFIDMGNNSAQAPVMAPYPTRNVDPTLMKYLDMLMGV